MPVCSIMSTTLISLNNVTKYDVKNVYNIEIDRGEFIILKGHNGSGKTTLMRLILGFIKPDKGSINVLCHRIAYLPEHATLPLFMKSYEYVHIFEKMKRVEIDTTLLHLFDIPLFRYIFQLSKGNKQKLAIITTLMGHADLLMLDEPLSGLDDDSITLLVNYLGKLKQKGCTCIVSSHHNHAFKPIQTREIHL